MKKILLITYYFPPCGGASVQRWLRLIKVLDKHGYDITVLTTEKGDYPYTDISLLERIPAAVKIIRTVTPSFSKLWRFLTHKDEALPYGSLDGSETASLKKKLLYWCRINLIVPDARVIWNPMARTKALDLCRRMAFDWVITTGPPHSTHLVGLYLKRKIRIKWMADFRDPWTQIFFLKFVRQNLLIKHWNRRLENEVVNTADLNLAVSKDIAAQLARAKIHVFYNGFDADLFSQAIYTREDVFRIKYVGQLTSGHNIYPLLAYISRKSAESEIFDLETSFIGTRNIDQNLSELPVNIEAFQPHHKVIETMVNSELLILLINIYSGNEGMLTTRLFEYIGSRTPILCLGPEQGEAAQIIRQAEAGQVFETINDDVWNYIYELYSQWQTLQPVRNKADISTWSVQQQVKKLGQLLTENG